MTTLKILQLFHELFGYQGLETLVEIRFQTTVCTRIPRLSLWLFRHPLEYSLSSNLRTLIALECLTRVAGVTIMFDRAAEKLKRLSANYVNSGYFNSPDHKAPI